MRALRCRLGGLNSHHVAAPWEPRDAVERIMHACISVLDLIQSSNQEQRRLTFSSIQSTAHAADDRAPMAGHGGPHHPPLVGGGLWWHARHGPPTSRLRASSQGLHFRFFTESRQLPETKFRPKFRQISLIPNGKRIQIQKTKFR